MHRVLPRPASPPMARLLLARLALSALSGALLALAMPGIDLGWLAWVALVPLLIASEDLPAGAASRAGADPAVPSSGGQRAPRPAGVHHPQHQPAAREAVSTRPVWLVEKSRQSASDLYSLVEYRSDGKLVRNDAVFEKDYIAGRYGAVPFIGDLNALLGAEREG